MRNIVSKEYHEFFGNLSHREHRKCLGEEIHPGKNEELLLLLQRHEHHRLEMFDNLKPLKQLFIEGEAEEVFQMQGEDERREDNTAGEEETTFTTSTEVSFVSLQSCVITTKYLTYLVLRTLLLPSSCPMLRPQPATLSSVWSRGRQGP